VHSGNIGLITAHNVHLRIKGARKHEVCSVGSNLQSLD